MAKKPPKGTPVVKATAFELFEDPKFVSNKFNIRGESNRGFPTLNRIYEKTESRMTDIPNYQALIRNCLWKIIESGQAVNPPEKISSDPTILALDALYRAGVLQSELDTPESETERVDDVYVFPSLLHKR